MIKTNTGKIILSAAAIAAGFGVGYLLGYVFNQEPQTHPQPQALVENVTPSPEDAAVAAGQNEEVEVEEQTPYYYICAENDKLCLYKIEEEQKELLKSEEVSIDVFPAEDRAMLLSGVIADDIEAALEIWESFIG